MIQVVIIGAAGRMGQALLRCIARSERVRLAGAVELSGCPALGRDAGVVAGLPELGVALEADVRAVAARADVLVDFGGHAGVPGNVAAAAAAKKAFVLGTTGLADAEKHAVRQAAAVIPVVWSPNMSVGVNLLFSMVRQAAGVLGAEYDVEIVETHHRFKKDAPSGTALRLGEKVAEGRGQDFRAVTVFGRQGETGERRRGEIGIHALRGGDVVGDHTVTFAVDGERVEFTHKASSRESFAMGALRAAEWAAGRAAGLYDMQDVLGIRQD